MTKELENNLDFSDYTSNICKTANQKLNALFRVSANMNSDKCTLLINSFIKSHLVIARLFGCSVIEKRWKSQQNTRTFLRLMTNKDELNYEELLDLTNEISPHQRCLNSLMIEVSKYLNRLSPDIMNDILVGSKRRYNTRDYNLFVTDWNAQNWKIWLKFNFMLS